MSTAIFEHLRAIARGKRIASCKSHWLSRHCNPELALAPLHWQGWLKATISALLLLMAATAAHAQSVTVTADRPTFTGAGQTVNFTFTCTAGSNGASSFSLTSPQTAPDCSAVSFPLAPNASGVCTGSYSTSAADVSAQDVGASAQCVVTDALSAQNITVSNYLNIPYYLTFSTASLPNGDVGTPYSAPQIASLGGAPPYTYTVSSGSLPAGLSLGSDGTFSGTPTTSGSSTFTVKMKDANSASAFHSFTIVINPALVATQAIPTTSLTINLAASSFKPVTGSGGTGALTYSVSPGLPAGLSFASANGAITGTPTAVSSNANFTVTVTDTLGVTATQTFALAVASGVVATQAVPSTTLTQNAVATGIIPVTGSGGSAPLSYSVSPSLPAGLAFDVSSGQITGTPTATSVTATYTVTVKDINNSSASKTFKLKVNSAVTATLAVASTSLTVNKPGTSFTPVAGGGGTGTLTYNLSSTLPAGLSFNTSTGQITGTPTAVASTASYTVTVTDTNGGTAAQSFSLTVNSAVVATQAVATTILTAGNAGTSFTPVTGSGGTSPLSYAVSPGLPAGLSMNSGTGLITGIPTTASGAAPYTVTVTDANATSATATFSLTVSPAVVTMQAIATSALTLGNSGTSFTPVTATGGTGTLTFAISPGLPAGLSFDTTSGLITGTPTATSGTTTHTVSATDANNEKSSKTFSLTVNPTVTATQAVATTTMTANKAAAAFTPVTGGGGTAPLRYAIGPSLPTGLSFNTATGQITGTATVAWAATTYSVTVTDANSVAAANTFSLTVNSAVAATLVVPTQILVVGGTAASFTPVTGSGGTSTLTYSISPLLPAGLSFSTSTGAITGTQTAASPATNYTVTVADSLSATASATFNLTVNGVVTATQLIPSSMLTLNKSVTPFIPVQGAGGTAPLSYALTGTLPAGLSFDITTGQITGTPTATAASSGYMVTVTDANSNSSNASFTLGVNSAVTANTVVAATVLTSGKSGTSFMPVAGSGGTAPLVYSVAPSLPAGLTLNPSTGAITGTPAASIAQTSFTMTVTDVNAETATATFDLTVNSPVVATLAIPTTTLTINKAATTFTPVTGSGGTGTLAYTVSPGLPTGLSFDGTSGAISGTATATSSSTVYTVTVTDTNSAAASASFSLTVNSTVVATQAVPTTTLTQGKAVTSFKPVTATGGSAPLTFAVSPALPAGLVFDTATGAITGTPSAAATAATYTVTITDINGVFANSTFSLAVSNPVVATQNVPATVLTQSKTAVPFTPVTGSGGTGTLALTISPSLPAGLTFDGLTGGITGTPTAALAATTFTVTVMDANSATATATFSLTVSPAVAATLAIASTTLTQDKTVTSFTPVTGSGGTAPLTFSVSPPLPAGLSFATNGAITGTPTAATGAASFTVTVTDANSATATATFSLGVSNPVVATQAIPTTTLTQNKVVTPITPVTGSGGTGTLTLSVSPSLPAGLAFAANGAITGTPTSAATVATYTVTVTDTNAATATATFNLGVSGAVAATQVIPSTTLTTNKIVTAFTPVTGSGGTAPLALSVSPALPAGLNYASNGAITGTPTAPTSAATYTVTVTDANAATATATFNLGVSAAVVATQAIPSTTLTANKTVTSFKPVTGSGGTGTLTLTVSPALAGGLSLASNGAITGTPTSASPVTTYTMTVTDTNAATASATFSLTVSSPVVATQVVAATTLTQGKAGTSFTPVTGSGGTGTLTLSVSPSLPAGLAYDASTGNITGTPTSALANTTFTVTVTDTNTATATATFTLGVSGGVIASTVFPTTVLTQSKTVTAFTPVTGAGGTGTLTLTVSPALPAGLAYNASTGSITGTPTAISAAATYTVTVTDTNASTASATFSLAVSTTVVATQDIPTTTLTQNKTPAAFTPVTGSGGTGTLTLTVSPGLPAGLAMNGSTGAINGTPTATSSATTYTVTVTDANSATATATFSLAVNSAVVATQAMPSSTLTAGKIVTSFAPVTGSGGTAPLTLTVSPSLPAGLSYASGGAITGTPTAASSATTYTVTVTDANSATASATFSLGVSSAVVATTDIPVMALTAGGTVTPTKPVSGSGGTGTLTLSVSPSLPSGLSLSSGGVITGTPVGSSPVSIYVVTVTDTNGATATANFRLAVSNAVAATLVIPTTALATNTIPTPFTPVIGSGGTSILTYAVSPALPAGLTFSSTMGAIAGTPTANAPSAAYTVTVSDINGASASATFSLSVTAGVVANQVIPSTSLTANKAAAPFTPVTGSGGSAPLTLTVNPALPAGLTYASTGAISGTATANSLLSTYTVTVTDANTLTATASFQLAVSNAVAATTVLPATTLTAGTSATAFTPVTGSGGTGTLSYSVSPSLPGGLSYAVSNGSISGTPAAIAAATTFTVTVTDANLATATATFRLGVGSGVAANTAIPSKALTVNAAVSSFVPVTGSGGTAPLTFTVSPNLPAGLVFAGNGSISGRPTAPSALATYTVMVTDANHVSASATFTLSVTSQVIATTVIPNTSVVIGAVGTTFIPVTATGGTQPLTFSISPALPHGMSFNPATASISGTPTAAVAARQYAITVVDANGATATQSFTLSILPPVAGLTVVVAANGKDGSFAFSSNIPGNASITVASSHGQGSKSFTGLHTGSYKITSGSLPAGFKLSSIQCDGTTQSGTAAIVNLTAGATSTCTFSLQFNGAPIVAATQQTIRNFMNHRANAIVSDQPDRANVGCRLSGTLFEGADPGCQQAAPAVRLRGSLKDDTVPAHSSGPNSTVQSATNSNSNDSTAAGNSNPVSLSGKVIDGNGQISASTSLADIMSRSPGAKAGPSVAPTFDIWTKFRTGIYTDAAGISKAHGSDGMAYLGADYAISPAIMIGLMAQFDWANESSDAPGSQISGQGWMAGPYVVSRLTRNITLDARAAWGRSDNSVQSILGYTDDFTTDRSLYTARLKGEWNLNGWRISPSANMSYYRERQAAFTDQIGLIIPQQTIALGQVAVGPEVGYKFKLSDGMSFEPSVGLKGLWNFAQDQQITIGTATAANPALQERLDLGANLQWNSGASLRAGGSFTGLGENGMRSYESRFDLQIPLN